MSRLGFKSVVYHGDACLGELEAIPFDDSNFQFPGNEIRIHHISPISERCSPLSVLQTVAPYSVRCKLESRVPVEKPHLINLHASCFHDLKTAVVLLGNEEVHLVAMPSKQKKFPCFWCFAVPRGLYFSCLWMLNLRCLAIVFDLDETLIVANTMKSFEDRIEVLRGWISRESDSVRSSGMSAELKRYMDDRALLRQYAEGDSVVLDGKELKVQLEEVPPLCDDHEKIVRPVVRLQERNIVLTRINPENRDTSVLVRLRPAWEDLRSYLTANGRKRFEVYVCTMAERDYAMEMWRLLDPEAHLISPKKILHRVVCVKSGSRKSLLNVFQDGICHPKMTMVIDDRLKVWEDVDQPRVHVVPAFTPYYAPQAEIANAVPVLCVARNVACNVRGGFFKEFDENLLRRISEVFYEDDMINLPNAPDVSNYLMSEDTSFVSNGNNNAPITEGMMGTDVTRRLQQSDDKILASFSTHSIINGPELRSDISQPTTVSTPSILGPSSMKLLVPSQKPSLLGPPLRRDKIKINQDLRNTAPGSGQVLPSFLQPQGDRLLEEEIKRNSRALGFTQNFDGLKREKQRVQSNLSRNIAPGYTISCLPAETSFMSSEEASRGPELQKQNLPPTGTLSENGASRSQVRINSRGIQTDVGRTNSSLSVGVLQEIGRICSSRVEFISVVSTSEDLHFSIEVFMTGEKIGVGTGKTRTDAEHQAAENALQSLADKYAAAAHIVPQSEAVDSSMDKHSLRSENGFLWDTSDPESNEMPTKDELSKESNSEAIVIAPGSTSELGNQRGLKRENSSRLQESISKRSKKEVFSDP